jgi:hypothetical protein
MIIGRPIGSCACNDRPCASRRRWSRGSPSEAPMSSSTGKSRASDKIASSIPVDQGTEFLSRGRLAVTDVSNSITTFGALPSRFR